jgi:hypothetical protein
MRRLRRRDVRTRGAGRSDLKRFESHVAQCPAGSPHLRLCRRRGADGSQADATERAGVFPRRLGAGSPDAVSDTLSGVRMGQTCPAEALSPTRGSRRQANESNRRRRTLVTWTFAIAPGDNPGRTRVDIASPSRSSPGRDGAGAVRVPVSFQDRPGLPANAQRTDTCEQPYRPSRRGSLRHVSGSRMSHLSSWLPALARPRLMR